MRDLIRSLISDALMDMFVILVKLYAVSSVARRSSRPLSEPSITRSPALRTAPPMQAAVDLACAGAPGARASSAARPRSGFPGRASSCDGRDHFDIHRVLHLGLHLLEQRRDLGEESEPAVLRRAAREVAAVLVERRPGDAGRRARRAAPASRAGCRAARARADPRPPSAARCSPSDDCASVLLLRASAKMAFAYGRAVVMRSAMMS